MRLSHDKIITVVFLFLCSCGIIAVFLFRQAPKVDYEVLYTVNGYSPERLEIPVGSRVAFRNRSDIPLWTASDPHPIHSDLSEFDARRDYSQGEIFVFQFTNPGTFGFHNHEKSIHRGIVRVVDPAHPAPSIDKTKESERATRDSLLALIDQNDPNSIFTLIDTIQADDALARDCHDMAHDLGHRAYELFGFSTAMTFNNPDRLSHTSADDICAGGYIHGILEELFLHRPELKSNPATICSSVPDNNRCSCFHGVGHGLMFVNKRDVSVSLMSCRNLPESTDIYRCFEGVWMEMFWGNTGHAGADSLGWSPDKPLEPCINAEEDEKPTCFLYAHLGYLREHRHDFTGAVDLCTENNLSETDTQFCLKGVGITMMKSLTSGRLVFAELYVDELNQKEKYAYYEGVIGYARLSGMSDDALRRVCNAMNKDTAVCKTVLKDVPR